MQDIFAVQERKDLIRRFAAEDLPWHRIDVAEHYVQIILSQRRKPSAIRQDISDQIMIVLHMRFLRRSQRITIEDIRSWFSGQRIGLKEGDLFKLRTPVGEDEGEEFEEIISEDILKQVKGRNHRFRGLFMMEDTDHQRSILKRESLDIWAAGLIVEGIHFGSRDTGILLAEQKVVGILVAVVINRFFAYFDLFSLSHGHLPSEREVIDAEILENAALDVCIKGFDGKIKFGMIFEDMIKRLAFIKKRLDRLSNQDSVRLRQVHPLP